MIQRFEVITVAPKPKYLHTSVRYRESQPTGLKNLTRPLHTTKWALPTATHSEIQPCHIQSRTGVNHAYYLLYLKFQCVMIQMLKEGKFEGKQDSHASFITQLVLQWVVKPGVFVATESEIVQFHKVQRTRSHRALRISYNSIDTRIPSYRQA
jgi:hypothetical protein